MTIRAGAARMDLTPELGVVLAGYGPLQPRAATGVAGRLWATALVIETADGVTALVAADLHAAPRALTAAVAEAVAAIVPRHRLLLGGTHTHSGPGHLYANGFYDWAGASGAPFGAAGDPALVRMLAARIAQAIVNAHDQRAPAEIRFGSPLVPDVTWQRSMEAFAANFVDLEAVRAGQRDLAVETAVEAVVERLANGPGADDPDHLAPFAAHMADCAPADVTARRVQSARRRAVIPCLDVVSAWRPDGAAIGAWGVLHATPTLMGQASRLYSADVAGEANRRASRLLGGAPVGLVGGAHGDTNVVPPGLPLDAVRAILHDPERASPCFVGLPRATAARWRVKDTIRDAAVVLAHALASGARQGSPLTGLRVRGAVVERDIADPASWRPGAPRAPTPTAPTGFDADLAAAPGPIPPPGTRAPTFAPRALAFAAKPVVGVGFLSGSNLTHKVTGDPSDSDRDPATATHRALGGRDLQEGWRREHTVDDGLPDASVDPHAPKLDAVQVRPDKMPSRLPLQALRLEGADRSVLLVGIPGEPTTGFAWRLRHLIHQHGDEAARTRVVVCAPVGQYCGYFGSPREYLRQSYEGAAQWWGRDSGVWVENRALEAALRCRHDDDRADLAPGPDPARSQDAPGRIFRSVRNWRGAVARAGAGRLSARWTGRAWDPRAGDAVRITLCGALPVALPEPTRARPLFEGPLFRVEVRVDGAEAPHGDEITHAAWVELIVDKPLFGAARARLELLLDLPAEPGWAPGQVAFRVVGDDVATPWATA